MEMDSVTDSRAGVYSNQQEEQSMRTLFARRLRAARSAAVLLMCVAMPVFGGIVEVEALLTPGQEVGPPDPVLSSPGTGAFSATYDDVTNLLSYTFSFED